MKKIRFESVLWLAWNNISDDVSNIRRVMNQFKDGKIVAAKARRMYSELRRVFNIDADRFANILDAAHAYDSEAFSNWYYDPVAKYDLEFTEFFEN